MLVGVDVAWAWGLRGVAACDRVIVTWGKVLRIPWWLMGPRLHRLAWRLLVGSMLLVRITLISLCLECMKVWVYLKLSRLGRNRGLTPRPLVSLRYLVT